MHRIDLGNIPAFPAAGLICVAVEPPALLAQVLFHGFAAARLPHTLAYATGRSRETRATLCTVGSPIAIVMAPHILLLALTGGPA